MALLQNNKVLKNKGYRSTTDKVSTMFLNYFDIIKSKLT